MNIAKRELLMDSFFASKFNYFPLVWICHHHSVSNKINPLHGRFQSIVYSDKESSFENVLDTNRKVPIHIKNVQSLATEMFQISK